MHSSFAKFSSSQGMYNQRGGNDFLAFRARDRHVLVVRVLIPHSRTLIYAETPNFCRRLSALKRLPQRVTNSKDQDWEIFQSSGMFWSMSNTNTAKFSSNLKCFPATKNGGVRIHSRVLVQADSACKYHTLWAIASILRPPHKRYCMIGQENNAGCQETKGTMENL